MAVSGRPGPGKKLRGPDGTTLASFWFGCNLAVSIALNFHAKSRDSRQ
jgi:hypothetical protein